VRCSNCSDSCCLGIVKGGEKNSRCTELEDIDTGVIGENK